MLETSLITVIYKRIGKFWYITQSELNNLNMIATNDNFEVFVLKRAYKLVSFTICWPNIP
jgi:hypothetical protein